MRPLAVAGAASSLAALSSTPALLQLGSGSVHDGVGLIALAAAESRPARVDVGAAAAVPVLLLRVVNFCRKAATLLLTGLLLCPALTAADVLPALVVLLLP